MKGERGKEGEMEKKGQLESMVKFKQMERMGGVEFGDEAMGRVEKRRWERL